MCKKHFLTLEAPICFSRGGALFPEASQLPANLPPLISVASFQIFATHSSISVTTSFCIDPYRQPRANLAVSVVFHFEPVEGSGLAEQTIALDSPI